jgi:Fic family protein
MNISTTEIDFLEQSNFIEGIYDSESLDHAVRAWKYIREQKELTIEVVLKVHRLLMSNHLRGVQLGKWRRCNVTVGGYLAPNWETLPIRMAMWIQTANRPTVIDDIIHDHVLFEKIHPFIDGNGRVGRILMNWEYLQINQPIRVIREEDRQEYYKLFK